MEIYSKKHVIYEHDYNKYNNITVNQTSFLTLNYPEPKFKIHHSSNSQILVELCLIFDARKRYLKDCWP